MKKMTSTKMRKLLEERLANENRTITFHRDKNELRIVNNETKKGVNVSIGQTISKWEILKEKAIDEIAYYVDEALSVMGKEHSLVGNEKKVFPVIRSGSFAKKTKDGIPFVTQEHTAETVIYYALDLGNTYRLIDEEMLKEAGWDKKRIQEIALFNLRSLPNPIKKDTVAENHFYFINTNDGYDASRILNDALIKEMQEKITGTFVISIPHADVLIFADIQNTLGYDILAQINMEYFTNGLTPITALSFKYEQGKLEPIFIMVHARPRKEKEDE